MVKPVTIDDVQQAADRVFNNTEKELIINALEQCARSYKRAQNQRPEFAEIARKLELELGEIVAKIHKL